MKLRLVLLLALVALLPVTAQAQSNPPVTTVSTLNWDAPSNSASAAQAAGFTYKVMDRGVVVDTLTSANCTGTVSPFKCSKNLTAPMVTAFNSVGQHSITMTATDTATGGGESDPTPVPFVLKSPPAAPTVTGVTR